MSHAIEIRCNPSAVPDDAKESVDEVKDTFNSILEEEESSFKKLIPSGEEEYPEHYHAHIRFPNEERFMDIIEVLSNDVFAGSSWFIIKYHVCSHEMGSQRREICSPKTVIEERGNVPEPLRWTP